MAEKKTSVDWDAVAIDIRAGILTDRQIGDKHGRSHGAIQQYAKKHGIERNLGPRIKQRAETKLARAELAKETSQAAALANESQVVEFAAQVQTDVVMLHRSDIAALRTKAREYQRELDECGEDLAKRVSLLKSLADTQKTLIGCEREAFGLSAGSQPAGDGDLNLKVTFGD